MKIKLFVFFSFVLILVLLVVSNDAGRKHLKKERRENVGSEIESLKKSFAAVIKKIKENAESRAGIGGNSTKEITLVPATAPGGKTKPKKLHGERQKKKNRRKTYKQGKSTKRNQTPNRKHKHIGKKFYKRRSHIKHARKFGKVWRGKHTQLKQVTIRRNGNKIKHIKKKKTLKKCKDDVDCPSKSCCVQQHHRNNKFCRRVGKRRCSSTFDGKKMPGRKLFQKMKNKMRRIAKRFKLKGAKDKFLEKTLKEIKIMKKILKEKFPGHKIYGREP